MNVDDDPIAHLFESNYYCFLTTNYDAVLKRYGEKCINALSIQVYPKNLYKPEEANLAYLHGAGFKVFENSYIEAYEKVSQITGFLLDLLYYDLVFVGFSMNDKYIAKFLAQLEELRNTTIRNNPNEDSQIFKRNKFIILPYHPQSIKFIKTQKNNEVEKINEDEIINSEDHSLNSQNLLAIRYRKDPSDPYKSFPNLIREIYQDAPNTKLFSKPYEIQKVWR